MTKPLIIINSDKWVKREIKKGEVEIQEKENK